MGKGRVADLAPGPFPRREGGRRGRKPCAPTHGDGKDTLVCPYAKANVNEGNDRGTICRAPTGK